VAEVAEEEDDDGFACMANTILSASAISCAEYGGMSKAPWRCKATAVAAAI
jgi:hypothetical protein